MVSMAKPKKKPSGKDPQAVKQGERLKKLRERHGVSQSGAAKLLQVPLRSYQNWEQGRTMPNPLAFPLLEIRLRSQE